MKLFSDYKGVVLKRNAVVAGTEKKVPIYLHPFPVLILPQQILKDLSRSSSPNKDHFVDLKKDIYASAHTTIKEFANILREKK